MSAAFVIDLALAIPLAGTLVVAAVRQVRRKHSPLAHLAVVALLLTTVDWTAADGSPSASGNPFWVGAVTTLAWLLLFLSYPDGLIRPRWAVWLLAAFVVLDVVVTTAGAVSPALAPLLLVIVATGLGCQVWRYARRASAREREAVRWALLGIIPFLAFCVGTALASVLPWVDDTFVRDDPVLTVIDSIVFWLVPFAAAAGLLLPSWLGLDRLLLMVVVVSGTGMVAGLLFAVLMPVTGWGWAAALTAAVVWPLGWLFRRAADRLVYGRARQPALADLDRRLESSIDPDGVGRIIATTVVEQLAVPYAAVESAGRTWTAGRGDDAGPIERFDVSYQGVTVATIAVAARRGDPALLPRDRSLLTDLARGAGAALHGAATWEELRRTRERIVVAREEERRRLRRDLHDDLAPTISGLALKASAAHALNATDPVRARQLIDDIEGGLRAAADQTRDLAYGLRPPILDDQGLVAAIRARIGADLDGPPVVTVRAMPECLELPAAVELAVLRIVQEAVSNTRRHARASSCAVDLILSGGELIVEISDDGHGIEHPSSAGMGLLSIRERVDELGGRSEIASTSAGTAVTVVLPAVAPLEASVR